MRGCDCGECRTCRKREYLRAYARKNRKRLAEYQREYRRQNAERLRERKRAYREANAADIKARKAAYFQANKDRILLERRTRDRDARVAQARDWAVRNPEKRREIGRRDKLRRRGSEPTPAAIEYTTILDGDPCAYCGEPGGTVDHIEPVVNGGSSDWDNLTAACGSCNSRKHARSLLYFLLESS